MSISWGAVRIRIGDRRIPVMQARAVLAQVGVTVSMSRTGTCYDNAVTASFFGTRDQANVWNAFTSSHEGRPGKPLREYVECFHNRVRRHSSLGYVSPLAFEQSMC